MTTNEEKLLNIIRAQDDPNQAIDIAIALLITFLDEHEAPQDTSAVHLRVTA